MALKSFIDVGPGSHFSIQNLPFAVFQPDSGSSVRPEVTIRDGILDLPTIASAEIFGGPTLAESNCFNQLIKMKYFEEYVRHSVLDRMRRINAVWSYRGPSICRSSLLRQNPGEVLKFFERLSA
ncbi:hypothetical protein NL676_002670 [Syzygium grande]|nr:hypothetical protein NL676_002670 [Syzygium grande]